MLVYYKADIIVIISSHVICSCHDMADKLPILALSNNHLLTFILFVVHSRYALYLADISEI
jgi:hypothetical protein